MSLTYTTLVSTVATMTAIQPTDPNFIAMTPNFIDYGEDRIYRDLDLISTETRDQSKTLTANSRNFTLPQQFVIVDGINVLVSGVRTPLAPASRFTIDTLWPSEIASGSGVVPQYFAMITDQTIIVGPPPGSSYVAEVIGRARPAALSASNPTTWVSTYLPDLLLAACMVFMSGYMKNFGQQSDDPRMAQSWETQYQTLKASAATDEAKKRFAGPSWTSQRSEPMAQPERG